MAAIGAAAGAMAASVAVVVSAASTPMRRTATVTRTIRTPILTAPVTTVITETTATAGSAVTRNKAAAPAQVRRLFFCSAEAGAVVRRAGLEYRPDRHDAGRVHVAMAAIIVPLDVIEVHGLGDARHLIKLTQVIRQVRIVDDPAQVALEVAIIDRVEADKRR